MTLEEAQTLLERIRKESSISIAEGLVLVVNIVDGSQEYLVQIRHKETKEVHIISSFEELEKVA